MANLCFFEESIDLVNYFINKIIKSKEEDQSLKNILTKQLNKAKNERGFLYNYSKYFESEENPNNKIIEEEILDIEEDIKEKR